MTDVVEINDKESVGEDGEVVRRRTIITLGPRLVGGGGSAAPSSVAGGAGSSSSINITLLNGVPPAGAGPVTSSQLNDSKTKVEQPAVANPDDTPQRANARASAFNARRTIEQRRQQQLQQQLQQQQQEVNDDDGDDGDEDGDEIQEPEQVREQSPLPVATNRAHAR